MGWTPLADGGPRSAELDCGYMDEHGLHCTTVSVPYVEYIRYDHHRGLIGSCRFLVPAFRSSTLLLSYTLLNRLSIFLLCNSTSFLPSKRRVHIALVAQPTSPTATMSAIPNLPEQDHHPLEKDLDAVLNKAIPSTTTKRVDSPTNSNFASPSSSSAGFTLHDVPIENLRPLKVIVVGAGYSGIYHGIRIPERLRNVELTIYDKNAGVGGTWFENRYPGCACDIPCEFDP